VQRFGGKRDKRGKHQFQPVDGLNGGKDGFGCCGFVGLDFEPGRVHVQVFVDLGGQAHHFRERVAQLHTLHLLTNARKARPDCRQQREVAFAQFTRLRNDALPMFVSERQNAVHQVAPGGNQFVVVALEKLFPVPVGIPAFGHGGCQIVAQRVRVVVLEEIQSPNRPVLAAADFASFQVHKLIRRHIIGQHQRLRVLCAVSLVNAVAESDEFCGPDDRVEGYIVLADVIKSFRVGVDPPIPPGCFVPRQPRPFNRSRKVANHRLEPHIQAFALPAFQRHWDPPIQVPGDGSALQAVGQDLPQRLADNIRPPVGFARFEESDNFRFQAGKVQVEMLGFFQYRRRAVHLGARILQQFRLQHMTAFFALVRTRVWITADVAGAFHVAIRQKALLGRGIPLLLTGGIQKSVFLQRGKSQLRNLKVVLGMCAGKQVVSQTKFLE